MFNGTCSVPHLRPAWGGNSKEGLACQRLSRPSTQIVSRLTSPGKRDGRNEVAPWIVALSCGFGSEVGLNPFFEKPDYRQQNDLADNGVNDLCDDAADENKAGQWQKPTCQDDPIMPTTMLNSKTVTLDELGLRAVPPPRQ